MPWPRSQFPSLPLDVGHLVHSDNADNDAEKIDRLADVEERKPLPGRCGMAHSYRAAFVAALRYHAACVRDGRSPWDDGE